MIAAGLGGRMDQTLGNLNLLTHADLEQVEVRLEDGVEEAWFFQNETTSIRGSIGDVVSLLPWGAAAVGITTSGLKYPLINETLYPDKTRGISNILMSETASVVVGSGRLLCIHTRN